MSDHPDNPAPVPAKKPLSEAQLAARRKGGIAAAAARSPEGHAASSRNGWKHGRYSAVQRRHFGLGATSVAKLFGKPCQTTCPYHPDNPERSEAPCGLVLDGMTQAGGDCLDKTVYANAFLALTESMEGADEDSQQGIRALMAAELSSNLELMAALRTAIVNDGLTINLPAISKEGEVIIDPTTGRAAAAKVVSNPALGPLIKLFEVMGINLPELLATPKARRAVETGDEGANAMQMLLGGVMQRMKQARPAGRVIEHGDETP